MYHKAVNIPSRLRKCPNCFGIPELTAWKAPVGIDPDMRQYQCSRCNFKVYRIYKGSRFNDLESQVEELRR